MPIVNFVYPITVALTLTSCAAVLFTALPAVSQESRTMRVLGSIEGTADGTERAWLTISGEVEGRDMATAAWRPFSMADALGGALSGMSDEQRAQMEERMEMMSELMGEGADNPLAQMFGGAGEEQVKLRIMGVDPEAERILRQGGLTIELPAFSADDADQLLTDPNEAEISYHKNFGEGTGFYVSTDDVGTPATVAFDRLDIVVGGGFAAGTFEGNLCPIGSLMTSNPTFEGCILVAGEFETELGEEEADTPPSPTSN